MKNNYFYFQIQFITLILTICLKTMSFGQEIHQFDLINPLSPVRRFEDEFSKRRNKGISSHDLEMTNGTTGDSLNVRLVGRWANGPCFAVAVQGDTAYFGNGAYMEIVDFSNPSQPIEMAKHCIPGTISKIFTYKNYAYLTTGDYKIYVIDVSQPYSPQVIGYFNIKGFACEVCASGDYLYVANSNDGLLIVDISNPVSMKEVAQIDSLGAITSVTVNGDYVYMTNFSGMWIANISNQSAPHNLNCIEIDGFVTEVFVHNNYAYIIGGNDGLRIIDVSNPDSMREVANIYKGPWVTDVITNGNYAYISSAFGICVIDITNPESPQKIEEFETGGYSYNTVINKFTAYVSDGYKGLKVIDISDPKELKKIGQFSTAGSVVDVAIHDSYIFSAEDKNGIRVLNLNNSNIPREIGYFYEDIDVAEILIQNNYAYIADYDYGLRIIDISQPDLLNEISNYYIGYRSDNIAIRDDYVYLANQFKGLYLINISDILNLEEKSHYDPGEKILDIKIKGNYAYLITENKKLLIIDLSNPESVNNIASIEFNGIPSNISIEDNFAYITVGPHIIVINVSQPHSPQIINTFYSGIRAYTANFLSNTKFIIGGYHGIKIFNTLHSKDLQLVGYYETRDRALSLRYDQDYIYVADDRDGLYTLEFLGQTPLVPILFEPSDLSVINEFNPSVSWYIPADSDGDNLHFKLEIATDNTFTNPIPGSPFESQNNPAGFNPTPPVPQGNGTCSFTLPNPLSDGDYWWRVSAWDGKNHSQPSEAWKFTIDTQKPYSTDFNPAKNATNVPITTNIMLHIKDDLSGVDKSTITMKVNQGVVTPTITGDSKDVTITYDPPSDFDYDQRISVIVTAKDLAGNEITEYYSFHTESKPENPAYIYMTIQQHLLHEAFEVAVVVKEVENLFGISFVFNYSAQYLEYLSTEAGDFLGNNILFIPFVPSNGQLPISITKKGTQPGSSGTGVIAKIKLKENTTATSGLNLSFSITEISAVDASYNNIIFIARDTSYTTPPDIRTKSERPGIIPGKFTLYKNYPNPFNPITTISYALPQRSHVSLQIFDLNGRVVKTLLNAQKEAGIHSVQWDARDNAGNRVASGIYICRLHVDDGVHFQKLILTK